MNTFRYGDLIHGASSNMGTWTGMVLGSTDDHVDIHGRPYVSVLILSDADDVWEVGSVQPLVEADVLELLIGRVTV